MSRNNLVTKRSWNIAPVRESNIYPRGCKSQGGKSETRRGEKPLTEHERFTTITFLTDLNQLHHELLQGQDNTAWLKRNR